MKNILILTLFLIISCASYAQVTIGSSQSPETFSGLQLDEINGQTRGLRLPQILNFTDINQKINTGNPLNAAGLLVFNKNTKYLNTWDGANWGISGSSQLGFGNGLSLMQTLDSPIGLGGKLNRNTNIGIGQYGLNFVTGTGYFAINNNFKLGNRVLTLSAPVTPVLLGAKNEVSVSTSSLSLVKNLNVNIQDDVIANPNVVLDVKTDVTTLDGDLTISPEQTHIITDASVATNALQNRDFLFSGGGLEPVFWSLLTPEIKTVSTNFLDLPQGSITNSSRRRISDMLELGTGTWLVYARVPIQADTRPDGQQMYSWFTVCREDGSVLFGTGISVDGAGESLPEIVGMHTVTAKTEKIYVGFSTSNLNAGRSSVLEGLYGAPQFFAILLDKPIER